MSLETQRFEFGEFLLDTREKVLLRNQKPVAITPKAFLLLQTLVENHGHTLAREQLMESVWADSYVEEGNLTFTINAVRKALGDSSSNPRFIETVPKRGYRFIADVKRVETKPAVSDTAVDLSGQARHTSTDGTELAAHFSQNGADSKVGTKAGAHTLLPARAKVLAGVLMLTILGAVAAGFWYSGAQIFGTKQQPLLSASFSSEKITSSGNTLYAAISPDGKYAAYVDAVGEMESVWMRNIDTAESVQITPPTENNYLGLTFSHDGNSVFFVRKSEGHAPPSLYRVTVPGGVPSKILDNTLGFVSLSPDDRQLSFIRCKFNMQEFCSLFTADADGKNERKILTRSSPFHLTFHKFSPDGKSIAVASGSSTSGSSDERLFEVDVSTGADREIAERSFFDIKGVDWLPDGSGLIISAKEFLDGKVSLWRVSRESGETTRLVNDSNNYFVVSLSKNADRMISTQVSNNYRLFFSSRDGEESLAAARDFAFAPNGKIVYASDDRNIWQINADGSEQRQLTTDPATDFSPRVSPDGRFIYFTSNRTGKNQVWRMEADGTNQVQITKNEGGLPRYVSSDGKEVFYLSQNNDRLWKVSAETGEEVEIPSRKLFSPAVSPDGTMVAYFFLDPGFKIGVMRLTDQQIVKVIEHGDGKSFSLVADWSPDSRTLYFVAQQDGRNVLWRQSLDEETPSIAAELGGEDIMRFAPSPDGQGFAFTRGKWMHDVVVLNGLR